MAPVVPQGHPTVVRAGDTWRWRISFADYPVSESWVLSYALAPVTSSTQAPLTWSSLWVSNDGAEYTVAIPAASTGFAAGSYRLTAFVTLSSQRFSPYSAPLLIEANAASLATGQGITHEEKTYAAIKALIEGRVVADVDSYQINGRALNRIPFEQLPRWLAFYRRLVWQQRNPGQPLPGQRLVTFLPCA